MRISDLLTNYILDMMNDENSIELKRNELAITFGCVPSQINYVLTSRFTPEQGYIVESRRGGGGHIKITKVEFGADDIIKHVIANIGHAADVMTIESILNNLYLAGAINSEKAKLVMAACSNNALSAIADGNLKNRVRADIFKNLLLLL